jgi:hypothetical protein
MDEHALAVDIHGFESTDFRDSQSGPIGEGENGFVFGRSNGLKKGKDLLHGEDYGKSFGSFRVREVFDDLRPPQSNPI